MSSWLRACPLPLLILWASVLSAQTLSQPSGVTISVTAAGDFHIQSGAPSWTYSGSIQGQVTRVSGPVAGADPNTVSANGPFEELTVDYVDRGGYPWRMQLRAYRDVPSVALSFCPLANVPNQGPYAVLTQFPVTPHHFSNGGWNRTFGPLSWMYNDSPWLFFDDQFRASILSPASRPVSQRQRWFKDGSPYGSIALAIDASNAVLPAGDVYSHLITFGSGIGRTFQAWGRTLRGILGRARSGNEADLSLIMPMLSTDAGASYYYVFDTHLGYEGTLQAAIASAKSVGIPLGVVHFDSWWYLKGGDCNAPDDASFASWKNGQNGVWEYVADPSVFPPIDPGDPQAGFVQSLGPGMAHSRWVDTCSPYRVRAVDDPGHAAALQPVSGNVITDLGLWRSIARALKQSGMVLFEQDFLSTKARAANTFEDERFLATLAIAMGEQNISLQYCMPLARHFLAAFQYPGVHTIRVSGDRFGWKHWDEELYGSMIANAGGFWPTVDNFLTTERRNLLLAVLSAGPLALGDQIGKFVPINEAIRSEGLILKPDESMVPTDSSFVAEAASIEQFYGVSLTGSYTSRPGQGAKPVLPPLVSYAYSNFGARQAAYVFAYSRNPNAVAPVSFSPQDFGLTGEVYVYNYFGKTGQLQPATQTLDAPVDSQGSYFVMAPRGPSGIAFLGDLSKYVTASKQRVVSLSDDGRRCTAVLDVKAGETVPIWFHSDSQPAVSAVNANVSTPAVDSTTGLYELTVSNAQSGPVTIQISEAN